MDRQPKFPKSLHGLCPPTSKWNPIWFNYIHFHFPFLLAHFKFTPSCRSLCNEAIRSLRCVERNKRNNRRLLDGDILALPQFTNKNDHLVAENELEDQIKNFYLTRDGPNAWMPDGQEIPEEDLDNISRIEPIMDASGENQ